MYCTSCGKAMDGVRMRCPECRSLTGAFWLNLFNLALWAVIAAINYLYVGKLLPLWIRIHTDLGVAAPLLMRLHAGLVGLLEDWGLPLLLLAAVVLLVLRWKKIAVPNFLKSGKAWAVLTWLALVVTTGAALLAFGFTLVLSPLPYPELLKEAFQLQRRSNEYSAIESVRRLNAAEASYRQKHPGVGFTCNLKDLKPHATFAKTEPQAEINRLFEGHKDFYSFQLQGCVGSPSSSYQIVAQPLSVGRRARYAFCSDQSGTIYFAEDGKSETCLSRQWPLY